MPIVSFAEPKTEFVVVTDSGIFRDPKEKPETCKELYIVHNGQIKASIKKRGVPFWFVRHFSSMKVDGKIVPEYDEYHIQVTQGQETFEEIYGGK